MTIANNPMIKRENLTRLLEGLCNERMIYVCAPAGYGKTIAVRGWLDADTRAKAIVSFDEYDNNPSHFCERFCEALRTCQPHNETLSEIVSHPAFAGAPDEFAVRAVCALSKRKRAILVIDDLHFIQDENVLSMLLIFLKRLPENFQIVLISRNDLPTGFSELWIKGSLARITAEQLRFSSEDIVLLYKKRGQTITSKQASEIYRFTQGWAIGINALLLSGGQPSGESLHYLEEFIRSNVWEKWDEITREFMLSTAMARALNPSLCATLSGISGSEKLLMQLTRSGAFLFRSNDGIYHYHHLFQGFLKHVLALRGDTYIFPLLEKEGEWHLSQQDFYSAAECFIRCKNHEGIAKCFDLLEVSDRNDFVIEKMLPIIRNPEIRLAAEQYPFLFYMMAWAAFADGQVLEMTTCMDSYYARFGEIAARDPAHAHNIFYMRIFDFRARLNELVDVLAALPVRPDVKGVQGSITMNMPMIHRCTRDFSELAKGDAEANITGIFSAAGWLFGEESKLISESLTGCLLYEKGCLERAHAHALEANAAIKEYFAPELIFSAMSMLICILDALGQPDEAEKIIKRLASMIEQHRAYYLTQNFNALTVRRKLMNGDMEVAQDWLTLHETVLQKKISFYGIYETFTTCRAYITKGNYDFAVILLKRVLTLSESYNRLLDVMEANMLLAIAYWKKKRGFQDEAMRYLEQAVLAAYEYEYTQLFINDGAALSGMLRRLQKRVEQQKSVSAVPASFIKRLYLKTLENRKEGLTGRQPVNRIEFTDKQKAVMRLQCEGKSYKEIAEAMGIRISTLRSHIALIYKKLDVTCEADAVMKIKSDEILSEE